MTPACGLPQHLYTHKHTHSFSIWTSLHSPSFDNPDFVWNLVFWLMPTMNLNLPSPFPSMMSSLAVAMCAVLARAWSTAVRAHGGGVSVHVSRRRCHYASVSGQERNKGESFNKKKTPLRTCCSTQLLYTAFIMGRNSKAKNFMQCWIFSHCVPLYRYLFI